LIVKTDMGKLAQGIHIAYMREGSVWGTQNYGADRRRSKQPEGGELRKVKVLVATLAMTLLLAAPAFAQAMTGSGGFNDLKGVTFGGNCAVNAFVEICDINTGLGDL
jgi:hypothetical protein